ncbi:lysyl-tRNA synthetase class 2 [Allocatelliglobosispora scoriae]|uniref:Lysine--tRNA ligase n=1 Tax=Allocatelliglobosispora scoriae TaxID=643052 RepID=A0A841BQW9_9ACTN|nr:bifunctional lysylphosphatidylglycerol synthetase/lysine--tRNA ligase LysX [Allocatelliglobosispora scoriae]MBB5869211.1 lysyl-tRNA synthetase class 2 [Allocatelliglobosispora scoriae]
MKSGWRTHVPRIFSWVLGIVAAICALAALSDAVSDRVQPVRKLIDDYLIPAPANLGYAAFLAILAAAAARHKRVARVALTIYFATTAVLYATLLLMWRLIPAKDFIDDDGAPIVTSSEARGLAVTGCIAVIALVVLFLARDEFFARVRKGSLRRALGVFAGLAAIGIGIGYSLVTAFPGTLTDAGNRLLYTISRVLGGAVAFDFTISGEAPGWVNLLLGLFGAIALFAALFTLMRSQQAAAVLEPADEERIRGLLARTGDRDSLGYFATRRDKAAVFAPSEQAAVTYRVVNGVSLASGDPIGSPDGWEPAIALWLDQARTYAWTPAVMGASEEGATAYAKAGLKVLHLGDEAILRPAEFTLDGRDMRPVRQAINRIERAGYTHRSRRHSEIDDDEMRAVAELATKWRDTDQERGFSMALGRLGDPNDGRCILVEALDEHGATQAMLSFSPWGARGTSLDLMRRSPDGDNGLNEFLVAGLMADAPRLGVDRVSLNFAVFRSVFAEGARIGAGPILRLWRRVLVFLSRFWQLESLYRANAKYQPRWVPRYLCFGERRELPRVGIASAIAEGFLPIAAGPVAPLYEPPSTRPLFAVPEAAAPVALTAVPEQMVVRLAKLDRLREAGVEPYPVGFDRTDTCGAVAQRHAGLAADSRTGEVVSVTGRVVRQRDHGRFCFATIRDWSGDLQVMLDEQELPAETARWRDMIDIGDHVGVTGEVITSRRGELSIAVTAWTLTAKCLRPLPDKHRGLTDPEARTRQRYLDLITNADARELLRARSVAVHSLRTSLVGRGFLEVETPILQRIHGGANARPFTTHINAYDMDLYLRIAPELYLKRLAVGGVERVFELGRTFRNEGVSFKHNPEFTMLEAYQSYADYDTMLALTRQMIQEAAIAVYGRAIAKAPDDQREIDISGEWPVLTMNEAISAALGEEVTADTTLEQLRKLCDTADVPYDPAWNRGAVVLEIYERLVEHHTVAPTFYRDFPTEVSPLTRSHRDDPRLAERWDLVAFGTELGTAYSELIDPVEQRRRLTEQSLLAAGGDPEAMELDQDFLLSLEYAMPPTGGLGIGVDRLVMLLTGHTIRETLPFPLVRA